MKKIESHPKRVSNIKRFVNNCNPVGINYPSKTEDWKRFRKNNLTIALNILYIIKICPAYKQNTNNSLNDSKCK